MQENAQQQFDTLVVPHLESLFRVARRLTRNTADAQDLVQDTCVAAFGNLAALGATDAPLRWLLRVQHNRFIDGERRRNLSPVVSSEDTQELASMASSLPDPEGLLLQFQNEALLVRAFLQLEGMQRTLLALRAD